MLADTLRPGAQIQIRMLVRQTRSRRRKTAQRVMGEMARQSGRKPLYQSYYGRRSGAATLLKGIIVFLCATLLVVVGVYILLQEGMVVDGDGVHVIPPWKWGEEKDPSQSPSPPPSEPVSSPSESLVIETEPLEPDPTLRELALETLQAVEITQTGLLSGRGLDQVRNAGGNAVLVEMKRPNGTLSYISSVSLAVSMGASGSDGTVNQAVRELIEGDVYTIAKVSCFQDHLLGTSETYALLTNSGYRWSDVDGMRWTCAANTAVQDYLIDLCVELAQMGFDEILLTNCGYPTADMGNLGWIRYGDAYPAGQLETIVGPFLARMKEALSAYDVRLSVEGYVSELAGDTNFTGLTMTDAQASCDHIWTEAQAAADAGLAAADPDGKLVPMAHEAGAETDAWAVILSS